MIYGIEVGVVVWSLRDEDVGKRVVMPGDGLRPVIVVLEADKKRPVRQSPNWLDNTRVLLGRRR
jgi:hypothetical protein